MMTSVSTSDTTTRAAPFLKWTGGKRQLIPELREHFPARIGSYYEPFVGGGAVFFDLVDRVGGQVYLNDLNSDLFATYVGVRDRVDDVVALLREHEALHGKRYYYEVRDRTESDYAAVAARMIYMNRTCFNGLYRVNRSGRFNVPMGRYANPTICDEVNLRACSRALSRVSMTRADFSASASSARRGDFVYCDPPYLPINATSNFTEYTAGGFSVVDHRRLAAFARDLRARGVSVLLSNADLPEIRQMYEGFQIRAVKARRNINSKSDRRGPVGELIIW